MCVSSVSVSPLGRHTCARSLCLLLTGGTPSESESLSSKGASLRISLGKISGSCGISSASGAVTFVVLVLSFFRSLMGYFNCCSRCVQLTVRSSECRTYCLFVGLLVIWRDLFYLAEFGFIRCFVGLVDVHWPWA